METNQINCPSCGTEINVSEILYRQLHSQISGEFKSKTEKESLALQKEKAQLQKEKSELEAAIAAGISKKLASERSKLEKQVREMIDEEKYEEMKSYKQQLEEKVKEVRDLNKLKADYQKLQREKTELKEKIEAEAEEKLTNRIDQERKRLKKELEGKNELKIAEREQIITQLKNQLKEAQRKVEQGSVQLQGEVMEVGLEDFLRANFPLDIIEEIKKGARGADCLQSVNLNAGECFGSIYYETKRTKDFQSGWIGKLKEDMQARNATFGVLVTETFPKDRDRMFQKDGIWICSYDEVKSLCFVLREAVIQLHQARSAQQDKGSKMEILYQYMTSTEFRRQVEAIVEGFVEMQENLTSERRAMESLWKQREKQIQKVLINTSHIYSSVKGIAGKALGSIKLLELTPNNNPK